MMMNDKEYRIGMVNLLFYYEFMMMMIVPMTSVFAPFVVHGATATRQHARRRRNKTRVVAIVVVVMCVYDFS